MTHISNGLEPRVPSGSINGDMDSLAQRRVDAVPAMMNDAPTTRQESTEQSSAVDACDISRSYKTGRKKIAVIKNMDLHLPRGKIYGLLGPSGCGKTTFLKCVTGRLRIHEGTLKVLGQSPNSPGHTVPGKSLGYMPQEEALFSEFTVNETLHFFARLHGMSSKIRDRRKKFLYALLEIEDLEDRTISRLSGGQKRRVSFACALLHNPDLLVLDEPTVGVDPLLRAKIWAYLQELTNRPGGPSILITTHYIEEARQSDLVGMMRDGALLAEGTPNALLRTCGLGAWVSPVFIRSCLSVRVGLGVSRSCIHLQLTWYSVSPVRSNWFSFGNLVCFLSASPASPWYIPSFPLLQGGRMSNVISKSPMLQNEKHRIEV